MEVPSLNLALEDLVTQKQMYFQGTKTKFRKYSFKKFEPSFRDNKHKWNIKNGPEHPTTRRKRLV